MDLSASIIEILKRVKQRTGVARISGTASFNDRLGFIIAEVAATQRPRTLTFSRGPASKLVFQVSEGRVRQVDVHHKSNTDKAEDLEALARATKDFVKGSGDIHIQSGPARRGDVTDLDISVEDLHGACIAPKPEKSVKEKKEPPATPVKKAEPAQKKTTTRRTATQQKKPAQRRTATKPKASSPRVPAAIARTFEELAKLGEETVIVGPSGEVARQAGDATETTLTGTAAEMAKDFAAWNRTVAPAVGKTSLLVFRPEGIADQALYVLPCEDFLLATIAPNRTLSHVIRLSGTTKPGGGSR